MSTNVKESSANRPRILLLASEVLFNHFFDKASLSVLSETGTWSLFSGRSDSAELRELLRHADALLTTWHSPFLSREMLGWPHPRVQLIAHCGGEIKARLEAEVLEQITVTNAPQPMSTPVAEMALALTLSLVRRLPQYEREMRAGVVRTNEEVSIGETIADRRIGIIGFGRIGREFARMIKPLAPQLVIHDPYCQPDTAQSYGAELSGVDDLLSSCSVVVLAAGLTPETRNMLDARRLELMPNHSYLINVARGGLIEMEALLAELRTGRISAALDVTDPLEPLPPDHELRKLPNVILTPHVAAGGLEMRRAIGAIAVAEVAHFFKGEKLQNIVTTEMLARMT